MFTWLACFVFTANESWGQNGRTLTEYTTQANSPVGSVSLSNRSNARDFPPQIIWNWIYFKASFEEQNPLDTLYLKGLPFADSTFTCFADTIEINLLIQSQQEIENIFLYVINERYLPLQPKRINDSTFSASVRCPLKLGKSLIEIAARNASGNTTSKLRILRKAVNTFPTKKSYAIIFANQSYNSDWDTLPNALGDAESIKNELIQRLGFDARDIEIYENPSKRLMVDALISYSEREYQAYDQLFIFFSGHGEMSGSLGYLIPSDAEEALDGISQVELMSRVNSIPCKHILLVVDACYSGRMKTHGTLSMGGGDRLYKRKRKSLEKQALEKMEPKSRIYMASGSDQVSAGIPGQHSVFVSYFLKALKGANKDQDGMLEFGELSSWIKGNETEIKMGHFGDGKVNGEFLFFLEKK
ncbi:MAG: caspase family protein [Bacteroidota bacterium]